MTDPADLAQTVRDALALVRRDVESRYQYQKDYRPAPYFTREVKVAEALDTLDELVRRLDQAERDRVEPREGIVTVYDDQGRYLGCMGIEMWNDLLRLERELVAVREIRRRYALASSGSAE